MADDPAELRRRAEACRRMADLSNTEERKRLWLEKAADWERLAGEADDKYPRAERYPRGNV